MTLSPAVSSYLQEIDDIPGWFSFTDLVLFDILLSFQETSGATGDLLEIGAYYGRSAIVLGLHQQRDERVIVCDTFQPYEATPQGRADWDREGLALSPESFLSNYSRFVQKRPDIVARPSSTLEFDVPGRSCRFVHIDGSHDFVDVDADIQFGRTRITVDGIVAIDDYRSAHTPGVAAASWRSVIAGDLTIACLSEGKMYLAEQATADQIGHHISSTVDAIPTIGMETCSVLGRAFPRLWMTP